MRYEDYVNAPIEKRLQFWIDLKPGDTLPADWPNANEWDKHIREVCTDALAMIRELTEDI